MDRQFALSGADLLDIVCHMCHTKTVTLFGLTLRPGQSIFDQLVSAAQKAVLSGELERGQAFPSVRALAAELKIHPNTAHKAVQYLIQERWLEMKPGIGTLVAGPPRQMTETRKQLMEQEISQMVSEAQRVGMELEEIVDAIQRQWAKTKNLKEVNRK